MRLRKLTFHRKLYVFLVERFIGGRDVGWERCGLVLLPDNAFREEVAHALLVFGIRSPRSVDRLSWTYAILPGRAEPIARPVARINDMSDRPLVRLVAQQAPERESVKDSDDVGRNKL